MKPEKKRIGWYKAGAVLILLAIACLSALLWHKRIDRSQMRVVTSADDLEGARIGGVRSYMGPDASEIYFRSMIGRNIASYREFDTFEDALRGLREGEVDAIWGCDVSAEYAVRKYGDLSILDSSAMAQTAKLRSPRFSFALAVKDDEEGKQLKKTLDGALERISIEGTLSMLVNEYIKNAAVSAVFTEDDMWSRNERFRFTHEMNGSLDIGITGSAPPVELIDENGEPYGFCVAFLDELACSLCTDINIRVLDTETAYSQLMAGKVDALLAGADSIDTTQEKKKFLTTSGYLDMYNYRFLVRTPGYTEDING